MSSPLSLDVFVAPCKPIVGLVSPMGEGEATWPATSGSPRRTPSRPAGGSQRASRITSGLR